MDSRNPKQDPHDFTGKTGNQAKAKHSADRVFPGKKKPDGFMLLDPPKRGIDKPATYRANHVTVLNNQYISIIEQHERHAWRSFRVLHRALALPDLPVWLSKLVDKKLLPTLTAIGIDEFLVKTLIQIALPAWESIGPLNDRTTVFDPGAYADVVDVEQGLLSQAHKLHAMTFWSSLKPPQELYDIVKRSMHPQNLFNLIDEVSTPWIILPRAYSFLEPHHGRYLLLYLDRIAESTNEQCLDKWVRIVIEFMANYAYKFGGRGSSKETTLDLLVNGYEAMFWRNLKLPPSGYEDIRIFENFLTWMSNSSRIANSGNNKIKATIGRMKTGVANVFSLRNNFISRSRDAQDIPCFKVALRHGCLGIVTTGKYFWIGPLLMNNGVLIKNGDRPPFDYAPTLLTLRSFFNQIKSDFPKETKRTQYFIKDFLYQFTDAYERIQNRNNYTGEMLQSDLQFPIKQMIFMTRKLMQVL